MKANPDNNLKFSKKRLYGGRAERKASYKSIRNSIKLLLKALKKLSDLYQE